MKNFNVKEIFGKLLSFCLKPCKTYDKEIGTFDVKGAFIFAGIVSVLVMVASILGALIGAIYTKVCFLGYCNSSWFNFGLINWASVTYQILLVTVVSILAVSGIIYLSGLVAKKEVKFEKLLTICSVSLIPSVVGTIVSSILGLFWSPLTLVVGLAVGLYEILTFVTLLNKEFKYEDDKKVLFYTIVFTIILVIAYVVFVNLLTSVIGSSLSSLSSLL